jgi:putative nucleotidyltransferase with HDIG domain
VTPEAGFLIAFGQTLATMALYDDGHPARERVVDASYEALLDVMANHPSLCYSFLGGETVLGERALAEMAAWDWGARLTAAGIERIEVDADVSREAYLRFVDDVFRRVVGRNLDTSEAPQLVRPPIRFGLLRVGGTGGRGAGGGGNGTLGRTGRGPGSGLTLEEEIEAVGWIHQEVEGRGMIPMPEVEAVVRSLAFAMRNDERMLLPLLALRNYDEYTTTHACNVAVLAMGVSERLGLAPDEVRSFGVAGLLHDIGKIRIPRELLVKPGRFTDEERQMVQRHPVDGAKIILQRERGLGLAAVVAYEHHVYLNGGGYPELRFPRACHYASRIVHVCDIYDALGTDRPYRGAWEPEQALAYLEEQAGRELDPDVVRAFTEMVREAAIERIPYEAAGAVDLNAVLESASAPAS